MTRSKHQRLLLPGRGVLFWPPAVRAGRRTSRARASSASPSTGRPDRSTRSPTSRAWRSGTATIIRGEGALKVGEGPVRTGVTAILPRGKATSSNDPVFAGWFALNGAGEMTGTTWVEESGFLEGPVMITNTHSVGAVHEGTIAWRVAQGGPDATGYWWSNPVVAETWDGELNDINGFHVRREHVFEALSSAKAGPRRRRQRRRRDGDDLQRLQGRHRNGLAPAARGGRRLHGRRARPVQLRPQARPDDRGRARRPRDRRPGSARRRRGLDHHRGRDRRAAASAPAETPRAPRLARPRPRRLDRGERFGRHLHRLLDGQSRRGEADRYRGALGSAERPHEPALRRDRPGGRGGHRQCHGGGRDDEGRQRRRGPRAAARRAAEGSSRSTAGSRRARPSRWSLPLTLALSPPGRGFSAGSIARNRSHAFQYGSPPTMYVSLWCAPGIT